jgi:segregation and condensation protein A
MNNMPDVGGSVPPVVVTEGEALSDSKKVEPSSGGSEQPPAVSEGAETKTDSQSVSEIDLDGLIDVTPPDDSTTLTSNNIAEIMPLVGTQIANDSVVEIPSAEQSVEVPLVTTPIIELPIVEVPGIEISVVDTPIVEVPGIETPVVDTPIVEVPGIETSVVDTPIVEVPGIEVPGIETSVVGTPIVEVPHIEAPQVGTVFQTEEPTIEVPIQQVLPLPLPLPLPKGTPEDRQAGTAKRKTKKSPKGIAIEPVTEEPIIICEAAVEKPPFVDPTPAVIAKIVSMTQRSTTMAIEALKEPSTVSNEIVVGETTEDLSGDVGTDEALEGASPDEDITLSVNAEQLIENASGREVAPSDGIEILVQLALKGEIDPKNVDIIDVTDKFLKLIAAAPKENLRQSGKILFHACVLLRMKAEALLNQSADEDPSGDDFLDFDENGDIIDSDSYVRQITLKDLEKAIVRRSQRRQVRKRQVTLEELIDALREAERIEKTRAEKKPARAVIELAGQHEVDGVDDLLDLAHDEDVESTIEKVELLLAKILKLGEKIELLQMVVLMDDHNDWVDAFLASLFLSNAGKIDLYQDEFYGPLFIGLGGS